MLSFLRNLSVFHKGLVLVSVPLVFGLLFVLTLIYLLIQADIEIRETEETRAIIAAAANLERDYHDAGLALLS